MTTTTTTNNMPLVDPESLEAFKEFNRHLAKQLMFSKMAETKADQIIDDTIIGKSRRMGFNPSNSPLNSFRNDNK